MTTKVAEAGERVRDLVCGMAIELSDDAHLHSKRWRGRTYFFCSADCAQKFGAAPEQFVPTTVSATTGVSETPGSRLIELPLARLNPDASRAIERAVGELAGVEQVTANPASKRVRIVYDPETTSTDELVKAVEDSAGEIPVATTRLGIEGMYCSSCVVDIERELEKTRGVVVATLNPATDEATVVYEPREVEVPALQEAVERAGYKTRQAPAGG